MRFLALDIGAKRIGLAVSDELGVLVRGLETLWRTNLRKDLAKLQEIIAEHGVTHLVVGRPVRLNGAESAQTAQVMDLAERLAQRTELPLTYWDERLTSVEAERMLREAGAKTREQRVGHVDRVAAVLILENFLLARQIAGGSVEEESA